MSSCMDCGKAIALNEWGYCAYCERMKQALYALLRRQGVAR